MSMPSSKARAYLMHSTSYFMSTHSASRLQVLLKHNVEVLRLMDEQERTPLHVAAQAGHTDCIRILLQYGAQAETVYAEHAEQSVPLASALHSAATTGNADALKMILDASGTSMVNAVDSFERTPLHLAASSGHAECVEVRLITHHLLHITCCSCLLTRSGTAL